MSTKIEWTQAPGFKGETWNPTTGCTRFSAGCDHCYAVPMTRRLASMRQKKYQGLVGTGHFNGVVKCHEDALSIPLRWRKPRMVFGNSMSDLFHPGVPFEFIDKVFAVMALCPQHTFQVLTKRPERMAEYLKDRDWSDATNHVYDRYIKRLDGPMYLAGEIVPPLPNVWLGTSVEDQESADERIPHLLRCPAAVRFLSCEPLLGEIRLPMLTEFGEDIDDDQEQLAYGLPETIIGDCLVNVGPRRIHWVIVGGESGPGARSCDIGWIRSIRDQCKAAGVPCFIKQVGARPYAAIQDWPDGIWFDRAEGCPAGPRDWLRFKHPKGGVMCEWPVDLRVREWPAGTTAEVTR